MKKIQVLLIDDNRLLRDGATAIINQQKDIHAVAAGKVDISLARLKEIQPQVILLDLSLSADGSLQQFHAVRKQFPDSHIVVTDLIPAPSELAAFVRAGIAGFILKHSTTDDFLNAIRSVAGGHKVFPGVVTDSLFSQIVEQAVSGGAGDRARKSVVLTHREQQVVDCISRGMTNKEIANELNIALHTVKSHVHNLLDKLALRTRLELAKHALAGKQPAVPSRSSPASPSSNRRK